MINVVLILINIFSKITGFQHKRAFSFSDLLICSEIGTMVTAKIHSRTSKVPHYSFVEIYVPIKSTNGNIRDCLLFSCAFIIYDVTLSVVLKFLQNISKTTFLVFLSFFPKKNVQILILKVEYLENSLERFQHFWSHLAGF